jgi:hypothetical protein
VLPVSYPFLFHPVRHNHPYLLCICCHGLGIYLPVTSLIIMAAFELTFLVDQFLDLVINHCCLDTSECYSSSYLYIQRDGNALLSINSLFYTDIGYQCPLSGISTLYVYRSFSNFLLQISSVWYFQL